MLLGRNECDAFQTFFLASFVRGRRCITVRGCAVGCFVVASSFRSRLPLCLFVVCAGRAVARPVFKSLPCHRVRLGGVGSRLGTVFAFGGLLVVLTLLTVV